MKNSAYKSLPKRAKLLLLVGCVLDGESVNSVLAQDSRHSSAFHEIVDSLEKYPKDMKRMILLTHILNELRDKI